MRCIARLVIALCAAAAGLQMVPASAEKRVALVIGNADYKIGPLANPVNDATAVANAFEKALGFDKVLLRTNLTFDGFRAALMDLAQEVSRAELGVVYFAGHGTEVAGKNFLIPVDARLAKSGDLSLEAIALDSVLEQLAGASRLKLVILDACRNNLFAMAGAKRSTSRGLSRIEPEDNTLVVYAARDGTTADDGTGQRHSPFTQALLKHLATPGLEITFVFRRVRDDVVAATNPVQTPHVYGTLGGKEFYLKPGQVPAPMPLSPADRMWAAVKDSASIPALEAFRQQYGKENLVYDRLAEARIGDLRKQQLAMIKAEAETKAAEEAKKQADLEARAKAAEAERQRLALQQEAERKRTEALAARMDPRNTLAIELRTGRVLIKLRPDLAPKHVERVKVLAERGFYNGLKFHRVIDGFMAQTGDPQATGMGGSSLPNLPAEFGREVFKRGSVGAARTSDPNSANSQFFICFGDACRPLTGQYTLWGEVIEGMEHVDKLARGEPPPRPDVMQKVYVVADTMR